MLKPASLRDALVQALPDYGKDPDRLIIFTEKGRIATRPTAPGSADNPDFEYRYDLVVTLLDFTGHLDFVTLPVLRWLGINQRDRLLGRATANEAITFEAEHLSAGAMDITFTIALTEAVQVTTQPNGEIQLQHLAEPDPVDPGFAGNPVLAELLDPRGQILARPPLE